MLNLFHLYFHYFLIDNHAPNYLTAEVKISFCILLPFLKNNDFHSSEEHRKHSPKCEFLLLNKKEEDWTVQEFLELETKRQMNVMVIIWKKVSS